MVRTTYRKRVTKTYAYYMVARTAILPPKTLARLVKDLHLDLEVIKYIYRTRYLRYRGYVKKKGQLELAWHYAESPHDHHRFVKMLRVTPTTFDFMLRLIKDHRVFRSRGPRPQAPVETQLAACLYRMGRFGNGASVSDVARICGVSEGVVENYTDRVQTALYSHHSEFVRKPTEAEIEREKRWIEEHIGCAEWRDGWIMYDGTIVVLYRKPGLHGDTYYTRKCNYGLNVQIGNLPSNLRICDYSAGLTGSAHDAKAFKNCAAYLYPDWFFKGNEFAWADSAYALSERMIPVHKRPASLIRENAIFDQAVSHLRVRSEHTMGALKGRIGSLRGLRVVIGTNRQHVFACRWVSCAIIIHNICCDTEGSAEMDLFRDEYDFSEEPGRDLGGDDLLNSVAAQNGAARRQELIDALMAYRNRNGRQ